MQFTATPYLVALLAHGETAAARLADAPPAQRAELAAQARRDAARLSATLDASPLEEATAAAVDEREAQGLSLVELPDVLADVLPEVAAAGWAHTLKLDELPTQDVAAHEYANLLTTFDAEGEIATWFFARPLDAMVALHRLISAGLVATEVAGRLRRNELAVHDGAQGMIVYNTPAPELVEGLMAELDTWLRGEGDSAVATLSPLLVAGITHERILEWQPFEAANGRLARTVSRVIMRARGMDPQGCAVVERELAKDVVGYYREVAATMRRGDLGPWLERYCEAAVAALEVAAQAVDAQPISQATGVALEWLQGLQTGSAVTIAEYITAVGSDLDDARTQLRDFVRAGHLDLQPGSGGLRYRKT